MRDQLQNQREASPSGLANPKLAIRDTTRGFSSDGIYTVKWLVEVESPFPPAMLYITARAPVMIDLKFRSLTASIMSYGPEIKGEDAISNQIQLPFGQYEITARSRGESAELDYQFD